MLDLGAKTGARVLLASTSGKFSPTPTPLRLAIVLKEVSVQRSMAIPSFALSLKLTGATSTHSDLDLAMMRVSA